MKTWLRGVSFQTKLSLLIVLATTLTVCLTAAGFTAYQFRLSRAALVSEISSVAQVVAANNTAALIFGDERTAGELLGAFREDSRISQAVLYGADGSVFATYGSATWMDDGPSISSVIQHGEHGQTARRQKNQGRNRQESRDAFPESLRGGAHSDAAQ